MKRLKNNKSGFILLMSVFLTLFISIMIASSALRSDVQLREADIRISSQQAYYAAESGIEQAVYRLRENNPAWVPPPGTTVTPLQDAPINDPTGLQIGIHTVSITPAPNFLGFPSYWVRSDGWSWGRSAIESGVQRVGKTLFARVMVPSAANFFMSTLGDIRIGSGSNFNGDVIGRDIVFAVDTNNDPPTIDIDGKVWYMRGLGGTPYPDPNINITGGVPESAPAMTFIGVDTTRYKTLAQADGKFLQGNQDFTSLGAINKQTLDTNNGVVYVEGDVHIDGQFTDRLLIVATGDIYIHDNFQDGTGGALPQPVGLFAGEDVIIPETAPVNMRVDAFVVADGGVFKAEGVRGSKGTLDFNGAMAARGSASGDMAFDLNTYADRDYFLNSQLSQVPFLPNLASIVNWYEEKNFAAVTPLPPPSEPPAPPPPPEPPPSPH